MITGSVPGEASTASTTYRRIPYTGGRSFPVRVRPPSIDRNVGGRPPDEDDARAAGDGPDWKEIQVLATHRERRVDTMRHKRNRQDEPVQVGPVRHQEQQRVLAVQSPNPPSLFLVDLDIVRAVQPLPEVIPYPLDPR